MDKNRTIVGLDIGTTKIGVFIGEVDDDFQVKVVGIGTSPSDGLKKGTVANIDAIVRSVNKAIEEAENMAGIDVKEVYVGIAGRHIRSIQGHGIQPIARSASEITHADVNRVIEQASMIPLPADRQIIEVIPRDFTVDDQKGIKDPVGMSGVRLEADVHIVTAHTGSVQNIQKSVEKAGIQTMGIALESLASAHAVLEAAERELGVAVVDIGGGTTDIAVFVDDSIRYTASIDLGGESVTNDIAICIRTPKERAEEIKKKYGTCRLTNMIKDETVPVPGVGGRSDNQTSREFLAKVVRARMAEIFQLVAKELQKIKLKDQIGAGIVLTGGASMIDGAAELAEEVFKMPVRIGVPKQNGGLAEAVATPAHATGVGLLYYGARQLKVAALEGKTRSRSAGVGETLKSAWAFIKNYI
jgi:cell division protein FtsA